ncbi:uncharacterized protein ACLA_043800 [Aspergillus clavatus NRRL 1]|uniref:SMP-30/Gluconolactonase/LRE-like region domain-containing protein n=1 Tax=Aspergillus clavatus (strain ATCC 1007 / CBS 513.65 / DSM 816 / NCTC 3887 / NRRL 1 / QM 1276 / 107) TaxID=344612 RepID=A1C8M3_ASPCL|nr:uncharacterized protein ACLA_043800 [Aspergillus clavatus NRRL 1]EAW13660.1 conserved hypothetical protein [Aspergillus clavatus NRRL 1]
MMYIPWLSQALTLASLATSTFAFHLPEFTPHKTNTQTPSVQTVFQFPENGSFIDNIVVRCDGTLLLTRIDVPEVWSVDPTTNTGSLVYSFATDNPEITACFGITEINNDVFAVVAGTFDLKTFSAEPGSYSVWELDFNADNNYDLLEVTPDMWRDGKLDLNTNVPTSVQKIVGIPEAKALGASTLYKTRENRYLLISDSPEGKIWRLDLDSLEYEVVLEDESMLPAPKAPPMGLNGIHVHDGYVYYVSVTRKEYRRVRIDEHAHAIGEYELLTTAITPDNFDIAADGTAYFATNPENRIVKFTPEGEVVEVAGGVNSTVIPGPTCCALDRYGRTLYVGTNGGLMAPVGGSFKEPGKVAAVRI